MVFALILSKKKKKKKKKKVCLFEFCLTKGLQNVKTEGVDFILGLFSV